MANWRTNIELIQKLYIAFYGRPADPGGLLYWATQLPDNASADTPEVRKLINSFINSSEAQIRFGNPPFDSVISRIYIYAFGRDITSAERAQYEGKTLVDVLLNLLKISSGQDYQNFYNKIQYANYFIEWIDPNINGIPDDDSTKTRFMANFSGNLDAELIKSKLIFINSQNPPTSQMVLNDIKNHIADPNDPILNLTYNPSNLSQKSNINLFFKDIATINEFEVKALDAGIKWNKKTITYSFLQSDPKLGYSNWRPLDSIEKQIVREAFSKISSYVDLNFVEVTSGGDIQFGSASLYNADGFTYYSSDYNTKNIIPPVYVHFNNDIQDNKDKYFYKTGSGYSGRGVYVIYHEIGHALGLKHPFQPPYVLPYDEDSIKYTIMSYEDEGTYIPQFTFDGRTIYGSTKQYYTPTNLCILDIQALQAKYGANLMTNLGDTIYDLSYMKNTNQPYFLTIWDAGGNDTIDFSWVQSGCFVWLLDDAVSNLEYYSPRRWIEYWKQIIISQGANPNSATDFITNYVNSIYNKGLLYTGEDSLAIVKGTIIENVKTGNYDDIVYDNPYDNFIQTNGGNDKISISGGFDTVDGGSGYDKLYLNKNRSEVSITMLQGYPLVEGTDFAVKLIGVEEIVFLDGVLVL